MIDEYEHTVKLEEEGQYIHVDLSHYETYLNVSVRQASVRAFLNKQQTIELIEALQNILESGELK
jgi:hypothetical protein